MFALTRPPSRMFSYVHVSSCKCMHCRRAVASFAREILSDVCVAAMRSRFHFLIECEMQCSFVCVVEVVPFRDRPQLSHPLPGPNCSACKFITETLLSSGASSVLPEFLFSGEIERAYANNQHSFLNEN